MKATVTKWNDGRGFGFALTDSGKEVFIHWSEIQGNGRKSLTVGDRVELDLYDVGGLFQGKNVREEK